MLGTIGGVGVLDIRSLGDGFGHGKRGCFGMGLVNREGGGFLLLWGGSWNGLGRFSPFFLGTIKSCI